MCQIAISCAQLTVCAVKFASSPLRNAVNIACCAVSLPLAVAGLTAISNPEAEHSVLTMHWYQFFFIIRSLLVSFDYGYLVETRAAPPVTSTKALIMATIVLLAILTLQFLNSLLVMAVIRIMRKRRHEAVAREAAEGKSVPTETTRLLGEGGYAPPAVVPAAAAAG
jgi:hypothetical protein